MNVPRTCALVALIAGVLAAGCESRGGNGSMDDKGAASAEPVTLAVVNARVWAGLHYRGSALEGLELGREVARWTLQRYFQPTR